MSDMIIEIINVTNSNVPTARGSYEEAKVTFKNKSFKDKVEAKRILDFAAKQAYTVLSKAKFGEIYYVTRVKNDKGYWDWTSVSTEDNQGDVPMQEATTNNAVKAPSVSPKSTYETAEERAARQLMIVRQSSISNAIAMLQHKGYEKASIDPNLVISIAKEFENYVFGRDVALSEADDVPL